MYGLLHVLYMYTVTPFLSVLNMPSLMLHVSKMSSHGLYETVFVVLAYIHVATVCIYYNVAEPERAIAWRLVLLVILSLKLSLYTCYNILWLCSASPL